MAAAKFQMAILFLIITLVYYCGASHSPTSTTTTLLLERIGSLNHSEVLARDATRHKQIFETAIGGVADFPILGSPDQSGLHFTRLKLGNPPREYRVAIDTGSDITWVTCMPCPGCPSTSLPIERSFYDPHSSSTAHPVSCSDTVCKSVAQASSCSSNSPCGYSIPYQDGTRASGYYVLDMLHLDTVIGSSATANSSANVVFGCTDHASGHMTELQAPPDGILGLGHQRISIISQLSSRGITPSVFSHCLKGADKGGGGTLVIGEVVEPGMIYSPLVLSQPHYNLNLLSISIGGQTVHIHRKVFATSRNRGTVVDSGTAMSYLAEEAFDPFATALLTVVPPSMKSFFYEGSQCFSSSVLPSLRDVFPLISLDFAGGASMVLKPETYLLPRFEAGTGAWCVGILKNQFPKSQGLTILGELVLKDKIVVYNLARQRLGWADYDCSSSVNVFMNPPGKYVSSSSRDAAVLCPLITIATTGFIVMFAFMCTNINY